MKETCVRRKLMFILIKTIFITQQLEYEFNFQLALLIPKLIYTFIKHMFHVISAETYP